MANGSATEYNALRGMEVNEFFNVIKSNNKKRG